MAVFLAIQIKLGNITADRVPEKYRAAVQAVLDAV